MANLFVPDYMFLSYRDITPEFLKSIGISALLIDIDNTLAPYEQDEPDGHIFSWFSSLKENEIKATLVSNNGRERVELFNRELGLPAFFKSGKPLPKNLKKAMAVMGSNPSSTAMLGDQLLTDAAAGKNIGLTTIIVPPIRDKSNLFFRTKRALEVPAIKKYVSLASDGENAKRICSFWLEGKYKKQ